MGRPIARATRSRIALRPPGVPRFARNVVLRGIFHFVEDSTLARRQVPIGNRYIADFVAPAVKLIIEVDGAYHRRRVTADARRTRVLERLGYRVSRLDAEVVLRQLPVALEAVRQALQAGRVLTLGDGIACYLLRSGKGCETRGLR